MIILNVLLVLHLMIIVYYLVIKVVLLVVLMVPVCLAMMENFWIVDLVLLVITPYVLPVKIKIINV